MDIVSRVEADLDEKIVAFIKNNNVEIAKAFGTTNNKAFREELYQDIQRYVTPGGKNLFKTTLKKIQNPHQYGIDVRENEGDKTNGLLMLRHLLIENDLPLRGGKKRKSKKRRLTKRRRDTKRRRHTKRRRPIKKRRPTKRRR